MSQKLIEVKDLKKYYNRGAIKALDGVSVDIDRGDVMVVIGPSGSGKSTFLRSLNLLEQPTGGSTYVVMPGDSLWKIAAELLGDGKAWTKIYDANKDIIKDPSIILIGIVLTIPAK